MISIDRFCAVVRRCAVCQATTGQWSTRRKQATNHWTNNSQVQLCCNNDDAGTRFPHVRFVMIDRRDSESVLS
jgi:hypothetical protein